MTDADRDEPHLVVHLVTPDGELWVGRASAVSVPAWDGCLGILPRHQPLMSLLGRGTLRLRPVDGDAMAYAIDGGFLSVDHDTVTVLADQAVGLGDAATPPGPVQVRGGDGNSQSRARR